MVVLSCLCPHPRTGVGGPVLALLDRTGAASRGSCASDHLARGAAAGGCRTPARVPALVPAAGPVAIALVRRVGRAPGGGRADLAVLPGRARSSSPSLGPVAVWFTLSWVMRLVAAYQVTDEALRDVNRDLEMHRRGAHPAPARGDRPAGGGQRGPRPGQPGAAPAGPDEVGVRVPGVAPAAGTAHEHQRRAGAGGPGRRRRCRRRASARCTSWCRRASGCRDSSRRILDVSRLEAGRLQLHLGPVALEPLLAHVATETLGPRPERLASGGRVGCSPGLGRRAAAGRGRAQPPRERRPLLAARPVHRHPGGSRRRPAGGACRRPWTRRAAARAGAHLPSRSIAWATSTARSRATAWGSTSPSV